MHSELDLTFYMLALMFFLLFCIVIEQDFADFY